MKDILGIPGVRGALSGLVGALVIDYSEFRKWKNWEEASAYNWKLAAWRWFQGTVAGAVTELGFMAVS